MDLVSYILAKNAAVGGSSGVSPTAKVTETDDGAVITITDAEGTTTVTIKHGQDGAAGAKGDKGDKGDTGAQGPQGEKGAQGEPGPQGPAGEKGETGAAGAKGDKGDTGEQGPQGETGAAGKDGVTPVKGVDYFTDAEIQSVVEQAATKVAEDGVIIQSSTEGSTKQFKLTVDDDGVITAVPIE